MAKDKKDKRDKIAELHGEYLGLRAVYKANEPISFVVAGLWISAKGTKHEQDVKEFIHDIYPDFFKTN